MVVDIIEFSRKGVRRRSRWSREIHVSWQYAVVIYALYFLLHYLLVKVEGNEEEEEVRLNPEKGGLMWRFYDKVRGNRSVAFLY